MESIYLIFILIIILLLIIGQIFKIYISYEPYENFGVVIIKLWCFKIKNFSFQIKPHSVVVHTSKQKNEVEYNFSDPKVQFYKTFSNEVKEKVKIKIIDINSKIGMGDASQTAILSGVLNIVYKIFCAYIKNIKPTCGITINPYVDFKNKIFNVSVYCKLSLSLFDFLYCVLYAFLIKIQST